MTGSALPVALPVVSMAVSAASAAVSAATSAGLAPAAGSPRALSCAFSFATVSFSGSAVAGSSGAQWLMKRCEEGDEGV